MLSGELPKQNLRLKVELTNAGKGRKHGRI